MLCYKDKTFCINPNCPGKTHEALTPQVEAAARRWWGKDGAPISMADLCEAEKLDDQRYAENCRAMND